MFGHIRCVLFDLDGTLIDSAADLGLAADEMRVARGLPSLPIEAYRAHAGAGARGMLGTAFGVTPEHAEFGALKEEFFDRYEQRMTRLTRPFEGVDQLLLTLTRQRIARGEVTNKSRRSLFRSRQPCRCSAPPAPSSAAIPHRTSSRIPRRWRRPCDR